MRIKSEGIEVKLSIYMYVWYKGEVQLYSIINLTLTIVLIYMLRIL